VDNDAQVGYSPRFPGTVHPKSSASERCLDAASRSLFLQRSQNSNLVGSFTLKRPDRRRAEAALWRAAKAEGRAPRTDNSWMHCSRTAQLGF